MWDSRVVITPFARMRSLYLRGLKYDGLTAKYQRVSQSETVAPTIDGRGKEIGTVQKIWNVVVHSSTRLRASVSAGIFLMLLFAAWEYQKEEPVSYEII